MTIPQGGVAENGWQALTTAPKTMIATTGGAAHGDTAQTFARRQAFRPAWRRM
jgi:hypothetical protein